MVCCTVRAHVEGRHEAREEKQYRNHTFSRLSGQLSPQPCERRRERHPSVIMIDSAVDSNAAVHAEAFRASASASGRRLVIRLPPHRSWLPGSTRMTAGRPGIYWRKVGSLIRQWIGTPSLSPQSMSLAARSIGPDQPARVPWHSGTTVPNKVLA